MATNLRHIRVLLIAPVAIVAMSCASGAASACAMARSEKAACASVCDCCESPKAAAAPATVPQAPSGCDTAPCNPCSCRSQGPAAPSPKPDRGSNERRTQTSHSVEDAAAPGDRALRTAPLPQFISTGGPPKVPLYLRNERLLF